MAHVNHGICEKCRKAVPARHDIRGGRVFIVKECPDCGATEALVSTDAAMWQRKREVWQYDPTATGECRFNCWSCGRQHKPRMVFLDITNRCNMNCPICIANIPGMGFEFNPPIEYFERVFDGLAKMDPKPFVNLFGGEPTVRDDLFDIIKLADARRVKVGIVTNGLRLADEEYCKKVCESGARVLLAFDGRDPEIYSRLRKNPTAYKKKLQALENLKKHSARRHTLMCCVARGINDRHMRDLIEFCHDNRDYIQFLHLIPLTETWKEGEFSTDITTTIEDVEKIIDEAFPDDNVEFLPAGLGWHFEKAASFFGSPKMRFGGVHPNCESATFLFSDGKQYRPPSYYFKRPIGEIAEEGVRRAKKIAPKLDRLNPDKWFQRLRARFLILRTFGGLMLRSARLDRFTRSGHPYITLVRAIGGWMLGKRLRDQLRKHTHITEVIGMVVLPFEESHSLEGDRLHMCAAGFVFEDPDTSEVKTVPVCAWCLFRDEVERKIAEKYAAAPAAPSGAGGSG